MPINSIRLNPINTVNNSTNVMDNPLGKPRCCSLTINGKLITAIKTDSKRGTSSDAANFIPAIMITSAALTMTARAEDEKDVAMLTLQVSD